MEANKKRFIRVAGELIEVSKEVYLTYYRGKRREKAQREKEQFHHVVSYDALDTAGLQGVQMIANTASPEPEDIVIEKMMCEKLHACMAKLSEDEYSSLYAFEKGEDGKMKIIPEQAAIVRELYDRFLAGASYRMLQSWLKENHIPTAKGASTWSCTSIKGILTNEKYYGDVLMQKTFRQDVISKKMVKNTGQRTQYLIQGHHEGIVTKEKFDAVQAEIARRNARRSPAKQAVTGRGCYTSKYALSDRLVCGECGTLYRRCIWTSKGRKYPVWRCISRLNYSTKYCHNSPSVREETLHAAILAAINSAMSNKQVLINHIKDAMSLGLLPLQGQQMSLADMEHRLEQLDQEFQKVLAETIDCEDKDACNARFAAILQEQTVLKRQKKEILQSCADAEKICNRMSQAEQVLEEASPDITEWNEITIRQLVERVTVVSADEICVSLKDGAEIHQRLA